MIDTIFALSSGSPPAAIAVVRVSGPDAGRALEQLAGTKPEPRRAKLATLRLAGGEALDRALLLWFPGPGSATGEDLAEFHLHGGRSVVGAVLAALSGLAGLRPAVPGEFTRRAFENGRIDLAEAEGLADLLMAETESQRRAAMTLAGGALSRMVEGWQRRLLALSAGIEAVLDFADEDDVVEELPSAWRNELASLLGDMRHVLEQPTAERLKDGIRIVIAGPPNAGKSTLLNRLAGREAAITSPVAGTTRDLVEAPTAIGGMPFLLIDTAGIRDSADAVEQIGVGRAKASLEAADLILWLGDPDDRPTGDVLVVQTKSDLPTERDDRADLTLSALTGEGIPDLVAAIGEKARNLLPQEGEVAINRRHHALLEQCATVLDEAERHRDPLIVAEELRACRALLDRITGRAGVEDMLDALFGSFCIGK